MTAILLIGTAKGLFLARSRDRQGWELDGPHWGMQGIYAASIDTRSRERGDPPRLLVGADHSHFGPSVAVSTDLGDSWHEPAAAPIAFPADTGASLTRVWQLAPGPTGQPDVVYAGTEPSGLFRSHDGGRTYTMVRGLWEHPDRPTWGPGFGGQAIHTVLPHPRDHDRILVAMSTGGVYQTYDGGGSWEPTNHGIDTDPESNRRLNGDERCVHKVARHPSRPAQLFLQNHPGVFRSDDAGQTWEPIVDGLPDVDGRVADFGFPIVTHPRRFGVVYNFPLVADRWRYPPGGRCRVYRTENAGGSWTALTDGLPQEHFHTVVLRDAMCTDDADPAGIYFGTRSGEVYASADEGEHWNPVAAHLPAVLCVRAALVG